MDADDMRTLDMQMQRPGPMGVKNVTVVHTADEKVADGDLLLVPVDSNYFVDPDNAEDAVQSIKPQTTVKYLPPHGCTLFGIVYAAQQQTFSIEESAKTAVNTPACTVFGTNAVVNRSGDVIRAFEKLTFGPTRNTPAPNWRQPTDATVTIRRVSPMVWRTNHVDLAHIARDNDLYPLFVRECKETCGYTVVPLFLAELYRASALNPDWNPNAVDAAVRANVPAPGASDRDAADVEYQYVFTSINKIATAYEFRPAEGRELIEAFLVDMYYDHMRNHEMMSLSRCPVNHHCETLLRF